MNRIHGQYKPNHPGAVTLADAKPYYIGGDLVTGIVYNGRMLAVYVGVKMIHDELLPDDITEYYDINPYIQTIAGTYEIRELCHEEALQMNHEYDMENDQLAANDEAERCLMRGESRYWKTTAELYAELAELKTQPQNSHDNDDTEPVPFLDGDYVAITRDGFRYFGKIIGQFDIIHYTVSIRTYKVKVGEIVHYATASELMHARRRNA